MKDPVTHTPEYLRARAAQCEALASQTQNLASRQVFQTLAMRWRKLATEESFREPMSDDFLPANVTRLNSSWPRLTRPSDDARVKPSDGEREKAI